MGVGRTVIAGHCTIDDIHQANGQVLPATPGGAAAYAMLGAVMYGTPVALVSLLGDDYPFDRFCDGFADYENVDLRGVRWAAPRSIHNVAWYRNDGVRHFDVESWDVMEELTPTAADLAPFVLADTVVLLTAASLPKQLEAARLVCARGCSVVVDTETHYFPDAAGKQYLRDVVATSTYFVPSIEHLQLLYDNPSPNIESYFDHLPALGCRWIIVKQGVRGSTLIDCQEGRVWHIPVATGVIVKDVTGAGDGFSGGFSAALADGKNPLDAASWGAVTASFVVECIGAIMPPHFEKSLALARYAQIRAGVAEFPRRPGREGDHPTTVGGHNNRDS